jgi:hypothetical protein
VPKYSKPPEPFFGDYELLKLAARTAPFTDMEREYVLAGGHDYNPEKKTPKVVTRLLHEGVFKLEERFSYAGNIQIIRLNQDFQTWGKFSVNRGEMIQLYKETRCWCGDGTAHMKDGHENETGKCFGRHWLSGAPCDCKCFSPLSEKRKVWEQAQLPPKPRVKIPHKEKGHLPAQGHR